MNKTLKKSILFTGLSVAMLTAGPSFAACMQGPYVSGNLAATWLQTQNYQVSSAAFTGTGNLHLPSDTGWGAGLAVGSQNGPYRLEAALDYLTNRVKNATLNLPGNAPIPINASGRVSATTLMVNGYYDFMPDAVWTPYVGVGLGVANINARFSGNDGLGDTGGIHDSDNEFAYQGIVGASWKVAERVKANIDYRYLSTSKANFNASANVSSTPINAQAQSRYTNNRVTAGVTYYFD